MGKIMMTRKIIKIVLLVGVFAGSVLASEGKVQGASGRSRQNDRSLLISDGSRFVQGFLSCVQLGDHAALFHVWRQEPLADSEAGSVYC